MSSSIKNTNSIRFTRLFPFHQRTIHKFMHDYVAQFTILSKTAQNTKHANTSASKNTKACISVYTESTGNALQLFVIVSPFATMFVHVTFKWSTRCNSHGVKVFAVMPIVVNVDGNPVFTSHIISLALLANLHVLQLSRKNRCSETTSFVLIRL